MVVQKKAVQRKSSSASEGKSIRWVVISAAILVAYLGWGFLAGSFAGSSGGALTPGRSGTATVAIAVYSFIVTSMTQLPEFFNVIGWHLTHRIWLPILFVMLEIGVFGAGYGLKRLEEKMAAEDRRHGR